MMWIGRKNGSPKNFKRPAISLLQTSSSLNMKVEN